MTGIFKPGSFAPKRAKVRSFFTEIFSDFANSSNVCRNNPQKGRFRYLLCLICTWLLYNNFVN